MSAASIFTDFWNGLVEHDEQGLFLVLAGFILSFAFIRMSTRLMRSPKVPWWPGSVVSESGVHLHHLVFGIVTMMAAGTLGFSTLGASPWFEICAFAFGVGAGLTIDEFALWVYLDDVYWAEEGRSSIDATVIAAAGMVLLLLGFTPFDFDTELGDRDRRQRRRRPARLRHGGDLLRQAAADAWLGRVLLPPARDLRSLAARQAGLALGPPALRQT